MKLQTINTATPAARKRESFMPYTPDQVGERPGRPPLTQKEREARAAWWNANEAKRPMMEWQLEMAKSDATMVTRTEEELIDKSGTEGLSPELVAKYKAKKALRAQKPDG